MEKNWKPAIPISKTYCIASAENTLRKIENVQALLQVNRSEASKKIYAICNNMYLTYLQELEDVFGLKISTLNREASGLRDVLGKLKTYPEHDECCPHTAAELQTCLKETIKRSSLNLWPFLCLQFVSNSDCPSLSYIKSSDATPKEVYLKPDRYVTTTSGGGVAVAVSTDFTWDPLLGHFLKTVVSGPEDEKVTHQWKDNRDGNYVIYFNAPSPGVYVITTKLYSQHVDGSPLRILVTADKPTDDRERECHSPDSTFCSEPSEGPFGFVSPEDDSKAYFAGKRRQSHGELDSNEDAIIPKARPVAESGDGKRVVIAVPPLVCSQEAEGDPSAHSTFANVSDTVRAHRWQHNIRSPDSVENSSTGKDVLNSTSDSTAVGGAGDSQKCASSNVVPESVSPIRTSSRNSSTSENEPRDSSQPLGAEQGNVRYSRFYFNSRAACLKAAIAHSNESTTESNAPDRNITWLPKTDSDSVPCDSDSYQSSWRAMLLKKIGCRGDIKFQYPIGLCMSRNSDIFVADTFAHRVYILDMEGREKHVFGKRGCQAGEFERPSALVTFRDGTVAIKDDLRIQLFSPTGQFISSIGKGILRSPYGLALDERENLITICARRPAALFSLPRGGVPYKRVPFGPLSLGPMHTKCRFLDLYQGKLFVADLGLSIIYKTDLDGNELLRFGSYGTAPGYFAEPSGIQVDELGNVLVADSRNNRIQVFDLDGQFKTVVTLSHPIVRPSGILLHEDRLLVLNYIQHTLSMFKLEVT